MYHELLVDICVSRSSVFICTSHNDCILNHTNVVPTRMGNFFKKGSQTADILVCMGSGARYVVLLGLDFVKMMTASSHWVVEGNTCASSSNHSRQ